MWQFERGCIYKMTISERYKFRVWDKKTSEMRGVMGFDYETRTIKVSSVPDRVFARGGLHTVHALSRDLEDVILMQYTGIDDINGVKIYEKDIISAEMDFGPAGYSKRNITVSYHRVDGYGWNYLNTDTIEVIGNTYEGVKR